MNTKLTLIPGANGLASFWDPIREQLPPAWEQSSFDWPGFGSSPARPDVDGYDRFIDHVASSIDVPSVVAGQSMGGFVALSVALRYPELVTHLVLSVAAGGVDMARHGAADWRVEDRRTPGKPSWIYDPTPNLAPQLGRLALPVLLVWATRDPISPFTVAQELEASIPGARLVSFDSDDHWVARRFASETANAICTLVNGSSW
jgi:pimeloyl-ACP methyl ester carboxylesterase